MRNYFAIEIYNIFFVFLMAEEYTKNLEGGIFLSFSLSKFLNNRGSLVVKA